MHEVCKLSHGEKDDAGITCESHCRSVSENKQYSVQISKILNMKDVILHSLCLTLLITAVCAPGEWFSLTFAVKFASSETERFTTTRTEMRKFKRAWESTEETQTQERFVRRKLDLTTCGRDSSRRDSRRRVAPQTRALPRESPASRRAPRTSETGRTCASRATRATSIGESRLATGQCESVNVCV